MRIPLVCSRSAGAIKMEVYMQATCHFTPIQPGGSYQGETHCRFQTLWKLTNMYILKLVHYFTTQIKSFYIPNTIKAKNMYTLKLVHYFTMQIKLCKRLKKKNPQDNLNIKPCANFQGRPLLQVASRQLLYTKTIIMKEIKPLIFGWFRSC